MGNRIVFNVFIPERDVDSNEKNSVTAVDEWFVDTAERFGAGIAFDQKVRSISFETNVISGEDSYFFKIIVKREELAAFHAHMTQTGKRFGERLLIVERAGEVTG